MKWNILILFALYIILNSYPLDVLIISSSFCQQLSLESNNNSNSYMQTLWGCCSGITLQIQSILDCLKEIVFFTSRSCLISVKLIKFTFLVYAVALCGLFSLDTTG